jgi:hypothetical protein
MESGGEKGIDRTIGHMAAELMEEIAEDYGGEAELSVAVLIVAVDHGDEGTIHWRFAPEGLHVHEALGALEYVSRRITSDAD